MEMCLKLEGVCQRQDFEGGLELSRLLRVFRGHTRKEQMANAKQSKMESFFTPGPSDT
jgi:hypothetical protein